MAAISVGLGAEPIAIDGVEERLEEAVVRAAEDRRDRDDPVRGQNRVHRRLERRGREAGQHLIGEVHRVVTQFDDLEARFEASLPEVPLHGGRQPIGQQPAR